MRVTRIHPVFAVRDLGEAVAYYRDKLAFTVSWHWGEPPTRAGVALGDIEIQLEGGGHGAPAGPSVAYCQMAGVDEYYADCRARGAVFVHDLGDRPWGMRDFRIVDPSGNRVGFGQSLPTESECRDQVP